MLGLWVPFSLVDWLLDFPCFVPKTWTPVVSPRQPREGGKESFKNNVSVDREAEMASSRLSLRGRGADCGGENGFKSCKSGPGCPPQSLPTCGEIKAEGEEKENCNRSGEVRRRGPVHSPQRKIKSQGSLLPDLEVKCLLPSILPRPQQSRQPELKSRKSLEL